MNRLISEEIINALGWTVLHSLWQALLVTLVVAGGMILLQKQGARWRYRFANAGLLTIVALAGITFFMSYYGAVETAIVLDSATGAAGTVHVVEQPAGFWQVFETYFNDHMPLIVVVWFMGMVVFLLRMLGGLAYVEYLKNRFTGELPASWQDQLEQLSNKLSLKRKVRLLESALVTVPMVIGWLKPVILIPVGAVNGLTMEQAEAVLAHELAHISRNDFLWNLLQSLVEVLFYFNPAVWWLSAVIRNERENCCDDVALELCENRLVYAKALVEIQEQNKNRKPGMALAFSGRRRQMLNRISRILNHPQNKSKIMEKFVITSLLLLAVLGISMSEYRNVEKHEPIEELSITAWVSDNDQFTETIEITATLAKEAIADVDTLPQGKNRLIVEREDEKMEVEIEDGQIKSLKVDGKEIPFVEYDNYTREIEELWNLQPEDDNTFFRFSPGNDKNFQFRSPDGEAFEFYFDDENLSFEFPEMPELPELHFDNKMLFLDKDGHSILVMPDIEIKLGEAVGEEYKAYLEQLKLKLEQNELFNDQELKELQEVQELIRGQYKRQSKVHEKAMDGHRIIIKKDGKRIKEHQRESQREAQRALIELKRELRHRDQEAIVLRNNNLWSNEGNDVVVFGLGGKNHGEVLVSKMKADGLIAKRSSEYKVELSAKKLKVNGKRQPDHIHQKYLDLYETLSGFEMDDRSKVVINKK
jgi:bla regulator protein BlaR1